MALRLNNFTLLFVFQFICSCFVAGQVYERPPAFAKKVYDDIFRAMDDTKTDKPGLFVSPNPKEVAVRIPSDRDGKSVVLIGQGLVDLCRNFGKDSMNALAHVLGHELAHVFRHQNDINMVGSGYASVDLKKQLKKFNDSLTFHVIERQADEFAAFYCHVAGYRTVHVGSAVLDSIYQRFKLTDAKLKKYPTLEERKIIVKNSEEQIRALKLLFNEGILSLVAGKYNAAQDFFQTILKYQFNSREIFNNLGVAYLMDALQELDTVDFPYIFPLQIDIQTKLELSTERSIGYDTRLKLEQALLNFERATKNSKDYSIGFINKAIVEFLLEDYDEMAISLVKAEKVQNPVTEYSVAILKAIHLDKTGHKEQALQALSTLTSKSETARRNFVKLSGQPDCEFNRIIQNYWAKYTSIEWPIPVYSKEQIAEGRRILERLGENSGVSLRVWNSEAIESTRWSFKKTIVEIQKHKNEIQLDTTEWEALIVSSDVYYKFGNVEFLVKDSLVLKKDLETISLYRLK